MPNNYNPKSSSLGDNLPVSGNPNDYDEGHPLCASAFNEFYATISESFQDKSPQSMEKRNPQLVAKILWMMSLGKSRLAITRETGVTMPILRRLLEENHKTVEEKRKELAGIYSSEAQRYIGLLQKKADLLEDDDEALKNTPPDKLAVVIGILTDHYNKLTGNNTITIEHKKGASIEDAQKWQDELRAKLAQRAKESSLEAEVITEQEE